MWHPSDRLFAKRAAEAPEAAAQVLDAPSVCSYCGAAEFGTPSDTGRGLRAICDACGGAMLRTESGQWAPAGLGSTDNHPRQDGDPASGGVGGAANVGVDPDGMNDASARHASFSVWEHTAGYDMYGEWDGREDDPEREGERRKYWDEIHSGLETMHRGVGVMLPPELHRAVHDRSRPLAERAHALLNHVAQGDPANHYSDYGLGKHWTDSESTAHDFAKNNADYLAGQDKKKRRESGDFTWGHEPDDPEIPHGQPATHVILHAHPERDAIDEDVDPNGDGTGMIYDHDEHGESEIPLHRGAGVPIKGITFKQHKDFSDETEADWDDEGERHDFGEHQWHTAGYTPYGAWDATGAHPDKPDAVAAMGLPPLHPDDTINERRQKLAEHYGHLQRNYRDDDEFTEPEGPLYEHHMANCVPMFKYDTHVVEPPENRARINAHLSKHIQRVPPKRMPGVSIEGPYSDPHMTHKTLAYYNNRTHDIAVHEDLAGQLETEGEQAQRGWFTPSGNASLLGRTMTHEYGHLLHRQMSPEQERVMLREVSEHIPGASPISARTHLDPWMRVNREHVINHVSAYGATKPSEMVAELYAEYHHSPLPSQAAKVVGRHLEGQRDDDRTAEPRGVGAAPGGVAAQGTDPGSPAGRREGRTGAASAFRPVGAQHTAKDGRTLSWDEVGGYYPHLYGDPEVHGEAADDADSGIGSAANELAHDRAEDPGAEGSSVHDLAFHTETVHPKHIDYARHGASDPRVSHALEGYRSNPEQVPPLVLVHRHGVFQVADGHHRAEAAHIAGVPVRAFIAHSPHPDEPFPASISMDEPERRAPFHGAEPHPGFERLERQAAIDGPDWCTWRRSARCTFPGTKSTGGSAVMVPVDRGPCPWVTIVEQQVCPISAPGPMAVEFRTGALDRESIALPAPPRDERSPEAHGFDTDTYAMRPHQEFDKIPVTRGGYAGYVHSSDYDEEMGARHNEGVGDGDFDEDAHERAAPSPRTHERERYDEQGSYGTGYRDRHDQAYEDLVEKGREEREPTHDDYELHYFISNHGSNTKFWEQHGPVRQVSLKQPIYATQPFLLERHLNRYLNNRFDRTDHVQSHPDVAQRMRYPGNETPLMVKHQGRVHAIEGHHRVAAELLRGKPSIRAHYFDADEHGFPDGDEDDDEWRSHTSALHAGLDREAAWHLTATWADVRAKAKRMRKEGRVMIKVASDDGVGGEVKGDHHVYETMLTYVPGTHKIGAWSCGCKWAGYAWGRSPAYARFEGRQCSHALAMQFEAQARGMFGKTVTEDTTRPQWLKKTTPVVTQYERPSEKHPRGRDLSRREEPPGNMRSEWHGRSRTRRSSLQATAMTMLAQDADPAEVIAALMESGVSHQAARDVVLAARGREAVRHTAEGEHDKGSEQEAPDPEWSFGREGFETVGNSDYRNGRTLHLRDEKGLGKGAVQYQPLKRVVRIHHIDSWTPGEGTAHKLMDELVRRYPEHSFDPINLSDTGGADFWERYKQNRPGFKSLGSVLHTAKRCPECGSELDSTARRCEDCGAGLPDRSVTHKARSLPSSAQECQRCHGTGDDPAEHGAECQPCDGSGYTDAIDRAINARHHTAWHEDDPRCPYCHGILTDAAYEAGRCPHCGHPIAHKTGALVDSGDGYHVHEPSGARYRLGEEGRNTAVAYHQLSNGGERRAGYLSWFGGKPEYDGSNVDGGVIHKAYVSGPHRRRGVASALLDYARTQHPEQDIRHSRALSDDGKAWADKTASLQAFSAWEVDAVHGPHRTDDARKNSYDFGKHMPNWGMELTECPQCRSSGCGHCGGTGQVVITDDGITGNPTPDQGPDAGKNIREDGISDTSSLRTAAYYHASPHDLDDEGSIHPPSATGEEPNFDADEMDRDRVFMTKTLEGAHAWGRQIAGEGGYRVYEVQPRHEPDEDDDDVYSSDSPARIVRRVHPPMQHEGAKKDPDPPTVAGVALVAADTGRVLMLQRGMEDEKDPAGGAWELPGGHIEDGDATTLHGGIREWTEEVGQPFPESGVVTHSWRSGPYQGHVVVIPSEDCVDLSRGRALACDSCGAIAASGSAPGLHVGHVVGLGAPSKMVSVDANRTIAGVERALLGGRGLADSLFQHVVADVGAAAGPRYHHAGVAEGVGAEGPVDTLDDRPIFLEAFSKPGERFSSRVSSALGSSSSLETETTGVTQPMFASADAAAPVCGACGGDLHARHYNPDDPGGDHHEQSAWWEVDHARKNPALRDECKSMPWAKLKSAPDDAGLKVAALLRTAEFDPSTVEYRNSPSWSGHPGVTAHTPDGERIGEMGWNPDTKRIGWVAVYDEEHRRKGVASGMLAKAREIDPEVRHNDLDDSEAFTDAGRAWATRVGAAGDALYSLEEARPVTPPAHSNSQNPGSSGFMTSQDPPGWDDATATDHLQPSSATLHTQPEPALPSTDGSEEDIPEIDEEASPMGTATTGSVQDIVARFQATAGAKALNNGSQGGSSMGFSDGDIAAAARERLGGLSKTALKDFTFAEQQELINEGAGQRARNFGDLKLEGTHYTALQSALDAADIDAEDILIL